jgi:hypothetical protein
MIDGRGSSKEPGTRDDVGPDGSRARSFLRGVVLGRQREEAARGA